MAWADGVSANLVEVGAATPLSYSDLADAFSPSDLAAGLLRQRGAASDNASMGIMDGTLDLLGQYRADMEDSIQPSDGIAALLRMFGLITESASQEDAVAGLSVHRAGLGDASMVADTLAGQLIFRAAVGQVASSTLSDALAAALLVPGAAFPLSFSDLADSFTPADLAAALMRCRAEFGNGADPSDSVGVAAPILAAIGDDSGWTDTVSALHRHCARASDATIPADAITSLLRLFAGLSESSQFNDSFSANLRIPGTALALEFAFADALLTADSINMKGWGLTALRSCTQIKLTGPDGRAVKLAGPDDRPIRLRGE